MDFWQSAEAEKSVYLSVKDVGDRLHDQVKGVLSSGLLKFVGWEFCYIPIVMGPDLIGLYPPRVKLEENRGKFFFSPQLDFETFKVGSDSDRRMEFIRGLRSASKDLAGIGLSVEQVFYFEDGVSKLALSV